jgi:hypothetical protein
LPPRESHLNSELQVESQYQKKASAWLAHRNIGAFLTRMYGSYGLEVSVALAAFAFTIFTDVTWIESLSG